MLANTITIEEMKFVVYGKDTRWHKFQPFANTAFENTVARMVIHDANSIQNGFDPKERQVFSYDISERGLGAVIYWRPEDPNYFSRISSCLFAANELYVTVRLECSDDIFDFSDMKLGSDVNFYEMKIKEIYLGFS